MRLHVSGHTVAARKTFPAEFTLVRPFPGVLENVALEHVTVRALEGAHGALIGLGTGSVRPVHVPVQLYLGGGRVIASLTLESEPPVCGPSCQERRSIRCGDTSIL